MTTTTTSAASAPSVATNMIDMAVTYNMMVSCGCSRMRLGFV